MSESRASIGAAGAVLRVQDLVVQFALSRGWRGHKSAIVHAVDGVDLELHEGECLGLVGESGCGKSTLALSIIGLQKPTRGRVILDGQDIAAAGTDRLARARMAQIVFQDPLSSLNPRQTIYGMLDTPLRLHGMADKEQRRARIKEVLRDVGLRPEHARRYPHEFSGGQRQRIGIARALLLKPKLVVLDEPVSALDVSIRAQIINLLLELKERLRLTFVMISHDLGVVEHMSDWVAVMYLGRIVEIGPWDAVFTRSHHPYTQALIASIPNPFAATSGTRIVGEVPSPLDPPKGCHFHPRCPAAQDRCRQNPPPPLEEIAPSHRVRCLRAKELA